MNSFTVFGAILIGGVLFGLIRAVLSMYQEAHAWREWNNLADLLEQYPDEIDFINEEVEKLKSSKEIRSDLAKRAKRN